MKKVPIRRCVGCGERKPKGTLIRIVYNREDDQIMLDQEKKLAGRGVYICPQKECIKKAKKGNSLARSLKIKVSMEIYNRLMEEIDNA